MNQKLVVRTEPVDELAPLIPRADPRHPLLWMRRGEGIVGLGEILRIETSGPTRIEDAAAAWRSLAEMASVDDRVGLPGTGLVAFGAIAFADDSASTSVLVVPSLVLGRREGRAWVTRIALADGRVGDGDRRMPRANRMPRATRSLPSRFPSRRRSGAFRA